MTDTISHHDNLDRRRFLSGAAVATAFVALPGCMTLDAGLGDVPPARPTPPPTSYASMYAAVTDAGHQLPAIPVDRLEQRLLRQLVDDPTGEKPGTIVVDTSTHHLYAVQPGGKAWRYGVSLGKSGFEWAGTAVIQFKKRWPIWTPPPEMIARRPELAKYSAENGGMPAGPQNPLGARALYLFRNGQDTMYRLHGTPEWDSIGKNASSGCVRLINQDVMDLFDRVPGVAPVFVRSSARAQMRATSMGAFGARATTTPIDAGVPADAERLG